MRRARRDAGFTMLELLLALALMSLIISTIVAGLYLARRAWESTRDRETAIEMEEAARALSDLLSLSYPMLMARENAPPTIAFHGLANGCRFVALSEGESDWGGFVMNEIATVGAATGQSLNVWTIVYRADTGIAISVDDMRKTQVLRDVDFLEFSYFGASDPQAQPVWSSVWTERLTLPRLVAVRLGAHRSGRPIETSFTVALRQQQYQ